MKAAIAIGLCCLVMAQNIESIINEAARKYNVEPALIKAIIKVESSYNPMAFRREPHIKDTSWGLMQVLLKTARWITKNPKLTAKELLNPKTNVDIGTRYLAYLLKKYRNLKDAIAAYNAGSPRKIGSRYVNQRYVDKVYANYIAYRTGEYAWSAALILPIIGAIMLYMRLKEEG